MKLRIDLPQALVITFILVSMGALLLLQLLRQQDLYFINKFFFGKDYNDFYQASLLVREGNSPYMINRYVTPPIPAIFNIPLTYISFSIASILVSFSSVLSVVLSFFLAHWIFNIPDWKNDSILLLTSLIILFFSYPFYLE